MTALLSQPPPASVRFLALCVVIALSRLLDIRSTESIFQSFHPKRSLLSCISNPARTLATGKRLESIFWCVSYLITGHVQEILLFQLCHILLYWHRNHDLTSPEELNYLFTVTIGWNFFQVLHMYIQRYGEQQSIKSWSWCMHLFFGIYNSSDSLNNSPPERNSWPTTLII